jgi:hypothetical protein
VPDVSGISGTAATSGPSSEQSVRSLDGFGSGVEGDGSSRHGKGSVIHGIGDSVIKAVRVRARCQDDLAVFRCHLWGNMLRGSRQRDRKCDGNLDQSAGVWDEP